MIIKACFSDRPMTPRFNDTSSGCAAHLRELDSYVDGELSPGPASDVSAHALQCAMCAELIAFKRALRHSLQKSIHKSASARAPASLRARLYALVLDARRTAGAAGGAAAHRRVPMRYAMALAALAGALFAAGVSKVKPSTVMEANLRESEPATSRASMNAELDALLDDLVALHKRPPAPETTNPEELRRFDLDVGVPVRRPAFQLFDAEFKGARLYMSREGRAALLQYTLKGDRRVSLYVFDPRSLPMSRATGMSRRLVRDQPVYIGKRGGYSITAAEQGGVGVALASDLDDDESSSLALAAIPK